MFVMIHQNIFQIRDIEVLGRICDLYYLADSHRWEAFEASPRFLAQRWNTSRASARRTLERLRAALSEEELSVIPGSRSAPQKLHFSRPTNRPTERPTNRPTKKKSRGQSRANQNQDPAHEQAHEQAQITKTPKHQNPDNLKTTKKDIDLEEAWKAYKRHLEVSDGKERRHKLSSWRGQLLKAINAAKAEGVEWLDYCSWLERSPHHRAAYLREYKSLQTALRPSRVKDYCSFILSPDAWDPPSARSSSDSPLTRKGNALDSILSESSTTTTTTINGEYHVID